MELYASAMTHFKGVGVVTDRMRKCYLIVGGANYLLIQVFEL